MFPTTEEETIKLIELCRKKGDQFAEASAVSHLADIYRDQKNFQKAVETLEEVVRIRKSLGDLDSAAFTLFGIANIYWARPYYPIPGIGDPYRAIDCAEQALGLAPKKSNKAMFLGQLSSWYAILGDVQRAIEYSDRAALMDEEHNFDREERMRYIREFAQRGYI